MPKVSLSKYDNFSRYGQMLRRVFIKKTNTPPPLWFFSRNNDWVNPN